MNADGVQVELDNDSDVYDSWGASYWITTDAGGGHAIGWTDDDDDELWAYAAASFKPVQVSARRIMMIN